jgi:FkbM family methyltransferase
VKLRELAGLAGWRARPKTYGFEVRRFDLLSDGAVEYAQWLHPGESPKAIRQDEVDHLRRFIRRGDVAIDVGAHSGDSTIPLALAAGPTGCVFALEPNPYVFPVLEKNATLNRDRTNIVALNFAAAAEPGPVTFEYSDAGFCNGGRHEGISRWRHGHAFPLTVRAEHLPSWLSAHTPDLISRIRFIKVDAEGYDLAVLRSMAGLIDRLKPIIRAEVYRHLSREQREALVEFFLTRGYQLRRVEDDVNYLGEPVGKGDVMRWRHFDLFAVPGSPSSSL